MSPQPKFPFDDLSKRESEVLTGLVNGKTREAISLDLEISVLTYDGYRKSIRQKLRIKSQADWGKLFAAFQEQMNF